MITLKEIKGLREYLVNVYHQERVKQQQEDKKYIDDTFTVPYIKEEVEVVRTGRGYRMVSAPAEHIITNNPQVYRKNLGRADANDRVAEELNRWVRVMLRQNPQPFKEHVKKLLGMGESWIYFHHNNEFDPNDPNDLPIIYEVLDPIIVFSDRGERDGIPARVIVAFDRVVSTIKTNYPDWTWKNQKPQSKDTDKVPFFMYFDQDVRYFEAQEEPLLTELGGDLANGDGVQENIYGIVPFVHAYSGFGEGTADGDPSSLAVGRLRKCRSLIGEYTAMRSTINHIIFQYAHSNMDLLYDPQQWTPPPNFADNYSRAPGAFNMVPITPNGKLQRGTDMLPDVQLFQYLAKLEGDIDREDPLGTISDVLGTSGRQQDMATKSSLRRYETIVENCASAFETAFGMGLHILEKLKKFNPLKEGDISGNYQCRIELAAQDPLENDRLRTLGERLFLNGILDLKTNLMDYQGKTGEQADEIMARILVDNATRNNPAIAEIMGTQAAREIGMEEQYMALKAQGDKLNQASQGQPGQPPVNPGLPQPGSEGGPPRQGNIRTGLGRTMADISLMQRGQRTPPFVTGQ